MRIGNPTRNGLAFTLFPIHLPKPYTPYLGLTVGAREQQRSILSGRQFYRLDSKSWMYAQLRTLRARFSPLSETRVWTTLQLPVCLSVALRSMRSLAVSVLQIGNISIFSTRFLQKKPQVIQIKQNHRRLSGILSAMKAIRVLSFGGPEVLKFMSDVKVPSVSNGQVNVQIVFSFFL